MNTIDYSSPEVMQYAKEHLGKFFATFPFFKLLGLEIVEIETGRAKLAVAWREDLCQPAGILHGGVTAWLVNTAIAQAILLTPQYLEVQAHGGQMVTIDLRIKYYRPVSSGRVYCKARVTRIGRQIVHADAIVTDEAGKEDGAGRFDLHADSRGADPAEGRVKESPAIVDPQ